MNRWFASMIFTAAAMAAPTMADDVTLSGLHLCCGQCVTGVEKAASSANGVSYSISKAMGTAKLSGSPEAVQKAVDAIAAAGYHGQSDNAKIQMKDDSGAPAKKVSKLKLTGFHNCCGGCAKGATKAVESVDGVKSHTIAKGSNSFEVSGAFDAQALIKALNAAGYHLRVAK